MRLEEVSIDTIGSSTLADLKMLLDRANQLYGSSRAAVAKLWQNMVGVKDPIAKDKLIETYSLILAELDRRGEQHKPGELDHVLLAKRLRGLDAATLPPVLVRDCVVSLGGRFATNPRAADTVDVRIDAEEFSELFSMDLEKRIVEDFMDRTGKPAIVRRDGVGMGDRIVPLYDLVLVPRTATLEEPAEGLAKRLGDRLSDYLPEAVGKGGEEKQGLRNDSCPSCHGTGSIEQNDGSIAWYDACPDCGTSGPAVSFVSKPFVGEHAARQTDPKMFDDMRRENDKFAPGIDVIWGIKGGKTKVQSIHFDAAKFSVEEAKAWLKEHDYKTGIEAAKTKTAKFIKSEEERIVGGIVYSAAGGADKPDAQGDWATADEIWKGLKTWMLSGHSMKIMHKGQLADTPLVECFFTDTATIKEGLAIPAGSWYISVHVPIENEPLWKAIKKGEITGFSMAGEAETVEEK